MHYCIVAGPTLESQGKCAPVTPPYAPGAPPGVMSDGAPIAMWYYAGGGVCPERARLRKRRREAYRRTSRSGSR